MIAVRRSIVSAIFLSVLSFQAMAQNDELNSALDAMISDRIAKTEANIDEALEFVESDLANLIVSENKKFLEDPSVVSGLKRIAKARLDHEENTEAAVSMAFSSLHRSLKLSPGLMNQDDVVNRALLIKEVASYYDKHDPSMCRYLPSDFNILLNIDMPWLTDVDEVVLKQAIEDEKTAIKMMLDGVLPSNANDSDTALSISSFVTGWFSELPDNESFLIARKRQSGNYCALWSSLIQDTIDQSENSPKQLNEMLAQLLLTPSRGWLDSGLWSTK